MSRNLSARVIITCPGRNFVTQISKPRMATGAIFQHRYYFAEGLTDPGEAPDLGVEIDEALAATHPYQRAYLPMNRLEDGTLYNS